MGSQLPRGDQTRPLSVGRVGCDGKVSGRVNIVWVKDRVGKVNLKSCKDCDFMLNNGS